MFLAAGMDSICPNTGMHKFSGIFMDWRTFLASGMVFIVHVPKYSCISIFRNPHGLEVVHFLQLKYLRNLKSTFIPHT